MNKVQELANGVLAVNKGRTSYLLSKGRNGYVIFDRIVKYKHHNKKQVFYLLSEGKSGYMNIWLVLMTMH